MTNTIVNELNAFLKGEIMAVDAYQNFIDAARDFSVKKEFIEIQKDHRNHIEMLSNRIKEMGGQPEDGTGFAGVMAKVKLGIENAGGRESLELLKDAYDGEDKGIAKAKEIIKGDLDADSRSMVNDILNKDHEHLSRMAHLIARYEGKS